MHSQEFILRFRPEVRLEEADGGAFRLVTPWGISTLGPLPNGIPTALRTLAGDGATTEQLTDSVAAAGDPFALAWLYHALEHWAAQALLSYSLPGPETTIVTLVPVTRGFRPEPADLPPDTRVRLTRFAFLRPAADQIALDSPAAAARALLPASTGAALFAALLTPATGTAVAAQCALPDAAVRTLLALLLQAGLVATEDTEAPPEDPALTPWEFHTLLMHRDSRLGRHGGAIGGTFPFAGAIPPLPAVKPATGGPAIPLHRPDLAQVARADRSLTWALEQRRSVRTYGPTPLTAQQLGEFLFRVARVRAVIPPDPADPRSYEASDRPYPTGGATHDLELYLAVQACDGLEPGLYHYAAQDHALEPLPAPPAQVQPLLRDATRSAPLASAPQVLIILASRFQRLSWKYRGIPYALTLKHVGVLYQCMYLVATAMGLAPCALGAGDPELFAAAAGTNPHEESSVGEFLLGSAPEPADGR